MASLLSSVNLDFLIYEMGIAVLSFQSDLSSLPRMPPPNPRLFPAPVPGPGQTWGEGGITSAKQHGVWNAARFPVRGAALAQLRIRFVCSRALRLWSKGPWSIPGSPANPASLGQEEWQGCDVTTVVEQISWGDVGSLPSEP